LERTAKIVQFTIPAKFTFLDALFARWSIVTFFRELSAFSSGVAKIRGSAVISKKKSTKIADNQRNISQTRVTGHIKMAKIPEKRGQ